MLFPTRIVAFALGFGLCLGLLGLALYGVAVVVFL
jgi:hypothetical protein